MSKRTAGPQPIFTRQDYESLIQTRQLLNDYITTCDKSEACGINVAVWRQQRDDVDRQLANIQQYFMTPPPK